MRLCLFFALITLLCTSGRAQVTLEGSVTDAKTQTTLPFVYVQLQDVNLGTVTEADGLYSLRVPDRHATGNITFSYLGYETKTVSIADLRQNGDVLLRPVSTTLAEVTVTPKKLPSAKAILRRVFAKLDDNYPQNPYEIEGYYRETLKENGAYVKYTDAAISFRGVPYTTKKIKRKSFESSNGWGTTLSGLFADGRQSLHRVHFHHQTMKAEQVKIIDSRASLNGTQRNMHGNIQGGPLSLFGRDRLKYQTSFLGNKKNRDFDFLVDEEQDENGRWCYVLHFHTTTTKEQLEGLKEQFKLKKKWRFNARFWKAANQQKMLTGKIVVDPDTYAILSYKCRVPNELKPYFCSYTTMRIKHFDYKISARFKKSGDKYLLDYLRHEDEFIFKDTTDQTTTPYAAISEFKNLETRHAAGPAYPVLDNFANVNTNELYEYALEYDSTFWVDYHARHPETMIGADIREDMENDKTLEQQFHDKQSRDENMPAPVAPVQATVNHLHKREWTDNYAWLKDTKNPEANEAVMDYLRAENAYSANYALPLRKVQRSLFREFSSQVEKNYVSLPTKKDGYLYYSAYQEEQEYPVYYRSPVDQPTQKDTLLDVNVEAKDRPYYRAGGLILSPNSQLMAYQVNTTGTDAYVTYFRDLKSKTNLPDSLTGATSLVWVDDQTLLYAVQEAKTLRSHRIYRHRLGQAQQTDELVYEENDPLFSVSCYRTKSKQFIMLVSGSSDVSEYHYLRADRPQEAFRLFLSREEEEKYGLSHYDDQFFILSDRAGADGQLYRTDTNKVAPKHWKTVIPHRPGVILNDYVIFDNYLVISEKEKAQTRLRVIDRRTKDSHYIKQKEDIYGIGISYNPDFNSDTLRYVFSSFRTPATTINYHLEDKGSRVIRRRKNNLYRGKYITKRLWAKAKDGSEIPVTLVYSKWNGGGPKSENKRLYLTAYGAYGSGSEPGFSNYVHALIKRGFTYAVAHVRGGGDLGQAWYDGGRMLQKKNTFTDFTACAEHLIAEGYAEAGTITAQGGSAGGLLMGVVANERPDLFRSIILDVPFVDVVNTMLDDKLPLTTGEYLEWGNPNKKKYFDYMFSYSPYENVKAQDYPHLFFYTGLNDTRVGYWEPAKMVAKLRTMKTDDNLLLLKTNFSGGHGGGSGRYAGLRESAYKLAVLFDLYDREERELGSRK